MSADPPEITTNEEWRILMVTARKERKWFQLELATRVARRSGMSATQALISQIESGTITSSKLVRPICEELEIPEPMHFKDEKLKKWWLTGHLMRFKHMELFDAQLEVAVQSLKLAMRAAEKDDSPEQPEPTEPEKTKTPRK